MSLAPFSTEEIWLKPSVLAGRKSGANPLFAFQVAR